MDSNIVDDAVCIGWFIMVCDLLSSLHGASVFVCALSRLVGGCSSVCLCLRWQPADIRTSWEVEKVNQTFVQQKKHQVSLHLHVPQQLQTVKLRHWASVDVFHASPR